MAGVLTTSSTVTCGHGGTVTVMSTQQLRINGNPVLVKGSIAEKTIAGCLTPNAADASGTPTARPCPTVSAVTGGEAAKLKVNGQAVMLDTLAGETDGMVDKTTPQKLLSATAGQTKLTAV